MAHDYTFVDEEKERYRRIFADSKSGRMRDAWGRFLGKWRDFDTYDPTKKVIQVNRRVNRLELKKLTLENVCEIVFVRRRPERAPGRPEVRRMICAKSGVGPDNPILLTQEGKEQLGWHPPITTRRIDEARFEINVMWDIMIQEYRNVSMDECYVRQIIPNDLFFRYFGDTLSRMNADQRMQFIDSY